MNFPPSISGTRQPINRNYPAGVRPAISGFLPSPTVKRKARSSKTVATFSAGRWLAKRPKHSPECFGKILQRQSNFVTETGMSTSAAALTRSFRIEIANLSQGAASARCTTLGRKNHQSFRCRKTDHARVSAEKADRKIPVINEFRDKEGNDIMLQQIKRNYDRCKADAQAITKRCNASKVTRNSAKDWD